MNLKEIERIVNGLQHRLFKNSNSYSVGLFKSQFKGAGLQFKEHQIYHHGDDIRFIDWGQSAKSQRTYIKTFEEERNVEVTLIVDLTPSLVMGYEETSKFKAMIELIALVYLITGKTQDLTSLKIWGHENLFLPKSSGQRGIVNFISLLEKKGILRGGALNRDYEFKQEADENQKLNWIKRLLVKRKEVLLLSDFSMVEQTEEWEKILAYPYLHAFQLLSPVELMDDTPYGFLGKTGAGEYSFGHIQGREKNPWIGNPRVKKLRVDQPYLERFVREMVCP